MAICKCKMCGGDLNITDLENVVVCDYCGTTQTVPSADSEKKMTLFNRANRLRLNNEFDKAAGIYESIVAEFPEEAEAYWGIVLCKYGIEYVDDPATGKKIPTCHRSSFESVFEDDAFDQACENADAVARRVYREEAKQIEDIRKGILEVSSKEEPYDIFICYKETDENGDRTIDSAIAQDVYDALTEKGYRVFFSRITLEDKLGQEYEPYIFAALNSAKVMLVFGTDYEYFNAVWVKNEWSRFLQLISAGQKKVLIPCFKGIDAYDMPKEFARLQSQDMGKVGAIQDLLRGIEKLLPRSSTAAQSAPVQTVVSANPAAATVDSLLKRAFMFLEDENWQSADEYAEKVLDIDPENGEAYLAKAMAELQVSLRKDLSTKHDLEENGNIAKALRYGTDPLIKQLNSCFTTIKNERNARELELAEKKQQLSLVQNLIVAGNGYILGIKKDGTVLAVGKNDKRQCNVSGWNNIIAVDAGYDFTVGLKNDGTVVATGNNKYGQCNTSSWQNIVAVSAGSEHTVGIGKDGTVVAVGSNRIGQCNVSHWQDIIAVKAGYSHTVGLRKDGTVVAVGGNALGQCDVSDWKDIVSIDLGENYTVGLKKDGTVVATGYNEFGQCNVSDWKNIASIIAETTDTIGVKKDGTVVHTGYSHTDKYDAFTWNDIISVSLTYGYLLGLKKDGTVIANELFEDKNHLDVSKWKDVVAIDADGNHVFGLRKNGTVLSVGQYKANKCDVSEWKLFDDYRTFEQERRIAMEEHAAALKKEAEERAALLEKEKGEQAARQARKELIKKQIDALIAEREDQLTALKAKEQLSSIRWKAELSELDEKIRILMERKESLGLFKSKEKIALQEKIDQGNAIKKKIQDKIDSGKKAIESEIGSIKSDYQKRLDALRDEYESINADKPNQTVQRKMSPEERRIDKSRKKELKEKAARITALREEKSSLELDLRIGSKNRMFNSKNTEARLSAVEKELRDLTK